MEKPNFITSNAEYFALKSRLGAVVDVSKQLPDMVFKKEFKYFYFMDFDWLFDLDAWKIIQILANYHQDTDVSMWAPDRETAYLQDFAYYPAIEMNVSETTESDYIATLEYQPTPEWTRLSFLANFLVFCGLSEEWGIWGDREFELAVIGTNKKIPELDSGKVGFVMLADLEGALNLVSNRFRSQEVPEDIALRFSSNYGPKTSIEL